MGAETALGRIKVAFNEIPRSRSMEGWKLVKIEENNDPLICLNTLDPQFRIKASSQYFKQGIPHSSENIYLRSGATERLVSAASNLPPDMSLVVFDAFRPVSVQEAIYKTLKNRLRAENRNATEDEITKMTERYVSLPSFDRQKPSPHSTGGAIDLSIAREDGELLEMGSEWDSFESHSSTEYFRNINALYHRNRELLFRIMTISGFSNYPEEWWHFDYGNQFWGHLTGRNAIYGIFNEGGDINDN